MANKERFFYQSVGLTLSQGEALDEVIEKEGGSASSHIRLAVNEYLIKKGFIKEVSQNA